MPGERDQTEGTAGPGGKPRTVSAARPSPNSLPRIYATDQAAWRAWLAANHSTSAGVWLVYYKKAAGKPSVTHAEAIDEALCFGWIDSRMRSLDSERFEVLFSPRKPRGTWSQRNKLRVAALTREGRMTDAGLAAVEAAKQDGSWNALDPVERLDVPSDLAAALAVNAAAKGYFDGLNASSRKAVIWWVLSAKRPATRARRVEETVRFAAEGKTAGMEKG